MLRDWEERLRRAVEADELGKLREATRTGAPYGPAELVAGLERKLDRRLTSRGRGRPRKTAQGAVAGV